MRPAGGTFRVVRVVVERLVVELEQPVRAVRRCRVREGVRGRAGRAVAIRVPRLADEARRIRPATRVPGPVDAGVAKPVADRRCRLQRDLESRDLVRLRRRLAGVDRVGAAGEAERRRAERGQLSVVQRPGRRRDVERDVRALRRRRIAEYRHAVRVENRVVRGRRAGERRRRRGDEPLVIEERPAERGLEEVVQDRVVGVRAGVQVAVDRQLPRVVVAHHEAGRVAPGDVPVLLPAVQLVLVLVEAVHDVARAPAGRAGAVEPPVRLRERDRRRRRTGRVRRLDVLGRPISIEPGTAAAGIAATAASASARAPNSAKRRAIWILPPRLRIDVGRHTIPHRGVWTHSKALVVTRRDGRGQ